METIKTETPKNELPKNNQVQDQNKLLYRFYQELDTIREKYTQGFYNDLVSLYQLKIDLVEKYGSFLYGLVLMKDPSYVMLIREIETELTHYLAEKIEELDWRIRQSGAVEHHWKQKRYTHIQMNDAFGKNMLDNNIYRVLVSQEMIQNEKEKYPGLIQVLWEFVHIWMGQINFVPHIQ